jgi:hypothetical protein
MYTGSKMKVNVEYGQIRVDVDMTTEEFLTVTQNILTTMSDAQKQAMETHRKTIQEAMMTAQATNSLLNRGKNGGNTEA